MKSLRFLLLFLIAAASFAAKAEETAVILNYEQLMDLSTSIRADYIRALRLALVDIEMDQRKNPEGAANFFSLFPEAFAADINDQCIFAGWVGTFTAPVDGHRYCHAPAESLFGCGGGEIKCNPAIFGDVPCVKKDTFATSTCDTSAASSKEIAQKYLSNAELKKTWDQLAASIDGICAITTRQQSPCQKIKKRLDAVEKRNSLPPAKTVTAAITTSAQAPSAKRTIDKVVHQDGTSTDKAPCKKNRLKGGADWGTCHAFCTLCTLDRLAAQSNFRTSANWVVFLSDVDRVCSPAINKPIITSSQQLFTEGLNGGDPQFDFNYALKYGFCDEESYLPYSDKEPPQPADHQTTQGLDAHHSGSPAAFTNQFGISFEDIKKLYCPTGTTSLTTEDLGYQQRLEGMAGNLSTTEAGQKFLKCARQSLSMAQKIKRGDGSLCKTETADFGSGSPDLTKIKSAIDRGFPVSLDISSPKYQHCVTAIAHDDHAFDIINFHGEGQNSAPFSTEPIKFLNDDKGRKIKGYWYVDCTQPASIPNPAPAGDTSHHHGNHLAR